MDRRTFLALTGSGATASLAGCLPDAETVQELPRPVKGDEESDTVLRVFEDLGCPACRQYNQGIVPSLEEEYIQTNEIRYEFYDYVLPANQRWSSVLANAARGVQERVGNDAFWEFIDGAFENQNQLSTEVLREIGEESGVEEVEVWLNDSEAGVYEPVIESDIEFGDNEYDVSGTPTLVLNDQVLSSQAAGNYQVLKSSIDQQLNPE